MKIQNLWMIRFKSNKMKINNKDNQSRNIQPKKNKRKFKTLGNRWMNTFNNIQTTNKSLKEKMQHKQSSDKMGDLSKE